MRTFGRPSGRAALSTAGRSLAGSLAEGGLLWLAGRSALLLAALVGWMVLLR